MEKSAGKQAFLFPGGERGRHFNRYAGAVAFKCRNKSIALSRQCDRGIRCCFAHCAAVWSAIRRYCGRTVSGDADICPGFCIELCHAARVGACPVPECGTRCSACPGTRLCCGRCGSCRRSMSSGTTRTGRRVRCAVLRRCAAAATVRR